MRRTMMLAVLLLGSLALVTSAMAQCGQSTLETVKKRGKLLAGVRYDAPPWGYVSKDGKVVGIDVDIARYIAKTLQVEIELVQVTAKTRIPMLLNGNVDLLAAGIGHHIARDKTIDYSVSYHRSGQKLLVKRESGTKSYRDLANKTVGVVQGTPYEKIFLAKQPKGKVAVFQEYPQAVLALEQGKVDAVFSAEEIVGGLLKGRKELELVGSVSDFSFVTTGLGLRENDSKWRDHLNFSLIEMWKNGTIQALYRTYLGQEPDPDFQIETWEEG